jgi:hypothetical protein
MIARRIAWIAVPIALASAAFAADPAAPKPASSAEVQQLQKQIEQMGKELADLKKLVESGDMPAPQRQQMMHHMGRMEGQMHGMMSSGCAMDPQSCPAHMGKHMGMSPTPR